MKREIKTGQRKGDRTMEKETGKWEKKPESVKGNMKIRKEIHENRTGDRKMG